METTNKKKKGAIKLIAFVLIVLLIAALNHYYGWSDIFSGDDWYGNLQQMVKTNFLQAALIYIVVMVIASVVLAVSAISSGEMMLSEIWRSSTGCGARE